VGPNTQFSSNWSDGLPLLCHLFSLCLSVSLSLCLSLSLSLPLFSLSLVVLGFELLRALCLLLVLALLLELCPQPFFLYYFFNRVSHLCWDQPRLQFSYLCFLHSCNDRHAPVCPAFYWLTWGLMHFFPRLASNCHPPDLCLWSS
jgi:hypothetical protein